MESNLDKVQLSSEDQAKSIPNGDKKFLFFFNQII